MHTCIKCRKGFAVQKGQVKAACPHCHKVQQIGTGSTLRFRVGAWQIGRNREDITDDMYADRAPMRPTGIREPSAEELAVINSMAPKPLRAEHVYVFDAVVSTNALDAYFTRMHESSLANYVEDARAGSPLLTGHIHSQLPLGKSFAGRREVIDGLDCVVVSDYMVRGYKAGEYDTDNVARGIDGGTTTDFSICFGGNDYRYVCSICGRDLFDQKCLHVPGVDYGENGRCFAWVHDAHMGEHSLVSAGATPGAVLRKARCEAEAGRLQATDIQRLEVSYNVRLLGADGQRSIPAAKAGDTKEERKMNPRQLVALLRGMFGQDKHAGLCTELESLRSGLPEEGGDIETAFRSALAIIQRHIEPELAFAASVREAGLADVDAVRIAVESKGIAESYRTDLIEETVREAIRAEGDKIDEKALRGVLGRMSTLDDIRYVRETYTHRTGVRLGEGGRQTPPADPNHASVKAEGELSRDEYNKEFDEFMKRTAPAGTATTAQ